IAAFAIHAPDQLDVLIEKVVARHFMGHHLYESRAVEIRALLELDQLADHFRRRHDPAQPYSWRERLRKSAQINHVDDGIAVVPAQIFPVQYHQRWEVLPFIAQLAVGVRSEEHTSELQSRENLVCR